MAMDMRMPDGALISEEFDTKKQLFDRFAELSAKGGKVENMRLGVPEPRREHHPVSDSPKPHQGKREMERRLAQLEKLK